VSGPAVIKDTTVACTINGKKVTAPTGTTILEAARGKGIEIPTLCYLKKLKPIGSCRICSVEVEGVDSMVMSCKTPVSDGMKITTENEKIAKYRQDMMRMILVDHPLDCPTCERSGECSLQDNTWELNVKGHVWETANPRKVPMVDWGLIQYDQNLCILCERCVKVCREVQGFSAYRFDGTGYDAKVNTIDGEKLDCDFCGQCISVCPVGALSSGLYFSGRSWEMARTESVCSHCGVGCTLMVNTKKGKVVRVTSDDEKGINNGNLCVRGRFGYSFIESADRLERPLVNDGRQFVPASWNDAVANIAGKLGEHIKKHGGNSVVGIGSERSTNEDNYAFQKYIRNTLGSGYVDNAANMANAGLSSGLPGEFGNIPMTASADEMRGGNLFVYIGADGSNESPVVGNIIREAYIDHGAEVAIAYSRGGTFLPEAKLQLTYDYANLSEFVASLIDSTVKSVESDGPFEGGEKASADFAKEAASAGSAKLGGTLVSAIDELVSLTREKGKPFYIVGMEAQSHPQAVSILRNVVNLARLTGGRVVVLREFSNTQGVADMGVSPNVLPGYAAGNSDDPGAENRTIEHLESGNVKVLIIMNEDIINRAADSARMRSAIEKIEYVVAIDQFHTDTTRLADVVLPSSSPAETGGSFTNFEGRRQLSGKAIDPKGESKPAWEIFSMLSAGSENRLGYSSVGEVASEISSLPLYKNGYGLIDYSTLGAKGAELKMAKSSPLKSGKGEFVLLKDPSLFSLGTYTDHCAPLDELHGRNFVNYSSHGAAEAHVLFNPADGEKLKLGDGDVLNFKYSSGNRDGRVLMDSRVNTGTIRVPHEFDNSALEEVKIAGSGEIIPCVNGLGLEGKNA
jgi:formate dehydrogenase alpha subunit